MTEATISRVRMRDLIASIITSAIIKP